MTSKLEGAVRSLHHATERHRAAKERHDQAKKEFDQAVSDLHLARASLTDAERYVLATVRREMGKED